MKKETLASVIKENREKLGISQRELSRKTGIDNNTIAKIEKGERKKPNILSLRKLSVALKIDWKYLMELSNYNDEDIKATISNGYKSVAIIPENAPIMLIDDIIKDYKQEVVLREIIKKLLTKSNIEDLEIFSNLKSSEKKKLKEKIKKYKKEIEEDIELYNKSINKLNELLNTEKK